MLSINLKKNYKNILWVKKNLKFKKYIKINRKNINVNVIYKNYPPCGRIPCECLLYLDLHRRVEKERYLSCYNSWFHFVNTKKSDDS